MTVNSTIYYYPAYYDLVFGSDWKAERDFLVKCFDKHVSGKVERLFEPACGTGRLMYRLVKEGYEVSGLDLNEKAVQYCNDRLKKKGYPESAFVADMTDFKVRRKSDAAFNTINSFRHLSSEKLARKHLECMAKAIRKGGIYALGLHLTPLVGKPCEDEGWSARRGHLCVNTYMYLEKRDLKKRLEYYRMSYDVFTPTQHFQIVNDISFRTYTHKQFDNLIRSVPDWNVAETYDFSYKIDRPIKVTERSEDVVYILQRQ